VVTLTVLVINYQKCALLERCLDSIETARSALACEAELIVIDNGSEDGSAEMVRRHHPSATLVELTHNEGFAAAVVRGTTLARGEWLVLVNNDAMLEPDSLALLHAAGASDARAGSVTPQVRFADRPGTVNMAGIEVDNLGIGYELLAGRPTEEGIGDRAVEVFGVSACVAAYRMAMLSEIGGFDASFFAYLEDVDVAWRGRVAGWRSLYEPRAVAYHHGSATLGQGSAQKYELAGRNRIRLIAKNATTAQLARWGWAMVVYDLAYVTLVAVTEGSLAPVRGRMRGLRDWRIYRTAGAAHRGPTRLAGLRGAHAAWQMRAAYNKIDLSVATNGAAKRSQ
jgi:GT2 family glycosyltransferase